MGDSESLRHSKWECKYPVAFIPKCRGKTPGNSPSLIQASGIPAGAQSISQRFDVQWASLNEQPEAKALLAERIKALAARRAVCVISGMPRLAYGLAGGGSDRVFRKMRKCRTGQCALLKALLDGRVRTVRQI